MKNPFGIVIGKHNKEKYHDRMIRWMADQSEDHGQGDKFLKILLREVFDSEWNDTVSICRNEYPLPHGSVDVGIEGEKTLMLIEDKVSMSAYNKEQIPKYEKDATTVCGEEKDFYIILVAPSEIPVGTKPTVKGIAWDKMLSIMKEWAENCKEEIIWLNDYLEFAKVNCRGYRATIATDRTSLEPGEWQGMTFFEAVEAYANKNFKDEEERKEFIQAHQDLYDIFESHQKVYILFSEGGTVITYKIHPKEGFEESGSETCFMGVYHDGTVWKDRTDLLESKLGISAQLANEFRGALSTSVLGADISQLNELLPEIFK